MTSARPAPIWRSMLFVPVNVPRFVDSGTRAGADAIILDLEDSIPEREKAAARALIPAAAAKVAAGGSDVIVRINRSLRTAIRDIETAIGPDVAALMLPKVESGQHVQLLSEAIEEVERERRMEVGTTRIVLLIETTTAYFSMRDIARAHPRIAAMSLGAEDFSLACGMMPEPDGLYVPRVHSMIAAREAGIIPLGVLGTHADIRDVEGFRAMIRRSKRIGFEGGMCIHPGQIAVLNEEYRPAADDVAKAERVVAAGLEAERAGRGSVSVDGRMVDVPIIERAKALIARDAAIRRQEQRRAGNG
ncbi:MAG: CoA ester lyase [Alphaproteobacteria bacterium]